MLKAYEMVILAIMLWREARGESLPAKVAVAHTIVNRVNNPGWWGNDIVSVVTKKWQYSSMTDPNDRQLTNWPQSTDPSFLQCLQVAQDVVEGRHVSPLAGIDSYYDDSLQGDKVPKWARENPKRLVGKIGRLNFYNLDGDPERLA